MSTDTLRRRTRRPRDGRVVFAAGLLVLILLLGAVVPAVLARQIVRAGALITRDLDPMLNTVNTIEQLMVDQETGQRGFILTGDTLFLEPYNAGHARLSRVWPLAEGQAARVGGDAPALLAGQRAAAELWQVGVGETQNALVTSGLRAAAVEAEASGAGKAQFDRFRARTAAFREYVSDRRTRAERDRDDIVRQLALGQGAIAVAALGGLGLLGFIVRQSARTRREADRLAAVNEAKDGFLSIVSHEVRTPLTTISGFAQLAQRQLRRQAERDEPVGRETSARLIESMDAIRWQSGRAVELLDQMLDLGRLDLDQLDLRRAPTDLVALARRVVEHQRPAAPGHTLVLHADPDSIVALIDEGRIEQVLINLVGNAVKYSPAGGQVTVSLTERHGEAVCTVHDQGMGVPPAEQERLFDRFYRASNARATPISGVGIGLYVCRLIAERHGGRLTMTSAPGRGSAFTFTVPLGDSGTAPPSTAP